MILASYDSVLQGMLQDINIEISPEDYRRDNNCTESLDMECNFLLHRIKSRDLFGVMSDERGFTVVAELGVQRGFFTDRYLYTAKKNKKYYLVDTWEQRSNYSDAANVDNYEQQARFNHAMKRLAPYSARTELLVLRNFTTSAALLVPDYSVDFIYVDARHDYCGVMEDLEVWFPKLKLGGIMAGDDNLTAKEHLYMKNGIFDVNDDWSLCANGTRILGAVKGAVLDFAAKWKLRVYTTWKNDGRLDKRQWPQWIFSAKSTNNVLHG